MLGKILKYLLPLLPDDNNVDGKLKRIYAWYIINGQQKNIRNVLCHRNWRNITKQHIELIEEEYSKFTEPNTY